MRDRLANTPVDLSLPLEPARPASDQNPSIRRAPDLKTSIHDTRAVRRGLRNGRHHGQLVHSVKWAGRDE